MACSWFRVVTVRLLSEKQALGRLSIANIQSLPVLINIRPAVLRLA